MQASDRDRFIGKPPQQLFAHWEVSPLAARRSAPGARGPGSRLAPNSSSKVQYTGVAERYGRISRRPGVLRKLRPAPRRSDAPLDDFVRTKQLANRFAAS